MERRAIVIRGIVQGVGFRPFVFGLASRLKLSGFVRNDDGQVMIEAEGDSQTLDRFVAEVSERPPALARIESVWWERREPLGGNEFRIETSQATAGGTQGAVFISPDVATCADCLRELRDPSDRRYRYPFINCTNCGPRLTIVTGAPYDRQRTTMASFAMCPVCQAEYDDPRDRRFHAQPTCCPTCGPQLEMLDAAGKHLVSGDPITPLVAALRGGRIVAIKGLGGFHLACTALDDQVVRELRGRKHRDEKPFAIMVSDVAAARGFCDVGAEEESLLQSQARPIVLLSKGASGGGRRVAQSIAPGNPSLGVMLPYTPLHYLMFDQLNGLPLVMTSGNRSDEPIAHENDDAVARLQGIADLFLVHNRRIHVRCDDSVTRVPFPRLPVGWVYPPIDPAVPTASQLRTTAVGEYTHPTQSPPSPGTPGERGGEGDLGDPQHSTLEITLTPTLSRSTGRGGKTGGEPGEWKRSIIEARTGVPQVGSELPIRRSRGYAPQPIALPAECRVPTLAVGGQLKGTFALGRGRHAFVSHHLGDLDHYEAFKAFERDVELYERLFDSRPNRIVHDLHPDYASTAYARRRGSAEGLQLIGVQHHHAHMASCMAENRIDEPVIGVSFDGTGFGLDGAVWGGEFLVGDFCGFRRAAHLRYVRMPGADTAIREPWRMALAHLLDAGCGNTPLQSRIAEGALKTVGHMVERGFNSPLTSSVGRLFDAVASLAGVRDRVSYEGQAAIELEWLAARSGVVGTYPFDIVGTYPLDIQPAPSDGKNREKDHSQIVDTRPMILAVVKEVSEGTSSSAVARRFHSTMAKIVLDVCERVRNSNGPNAVVLSGGVFMNVLLTNEVIAGLTTDGFSVYRHHLVPPNDAGLSLGQLAIAAARDHVSASLSQSE
jgi:hydrogenase maturation protein HypF